MNWKVISRNIGCALLVSALFMFFSIIISVSEGNDSALAALIISFTITFIVGIFPFIFVRKTDVISLKEGYVIITLSWLMSFVFGLLPYALWGGPFTLQNALFESVSGYTTCGATILDKVEALPRSLLFWRASTHFIGGLGVVVFLLLIIPESSPMRMRLTNMELTSLSRGGYSSNSNRVVFIFAYVYIVLVLLSFLAYMLAGMSPFDAICHAMSVVSTGGFSTRNISIAAFDSAAVEAVSVLFMYLSSLHFGVLYLTVVSRSLKPLNNPVFKAYSIGILAVSLVIAAGLKFGGYSEGWGESLWDGLFTTVSFVSTTGFATLDNASWPYWMMFLLAFCCIICGSSGSTCSGIKIDRAVLFFKSLGRYVGNILHPSSVNEIRMGRRILRDDEVYPHLLYIGLYLLVLLVSTFVCIASGMRFEDSYVASVMLTGNVGPGCGTMGTMGSFSGIPMLAKLMLSLDMFLGRIEIYPLLAVAGMIFGRRRR